MPAQQAAWLSDILEVWGVWGRYGLCLGVWLVASMRPEPAPEAARSSVFFTPVRWALRSTTG